MYNEFVVAFTAYPLMFILSIIGAWQGSVWTIAGLTHQRSIHVYVLILRWIAVQCHKIARELEPDNWIPDADSPSIILHPSVPRLKSQDRYIPWDNPNLIKEEV
jgi:hypothetical protein